MLVPIIKKNPCFHDFCHLLITFVNGLVQYQESGPIYGFKLFDTLIVLLKDFFEKVNFEKKVSVRHESMDFTQHAKSKSHIYIGPRTPYPNKQRHMPLCGFMWLATVQFESRL